MRCVAHGRRRGRWLLVVALATTGFGPGTPVVAEGEDEKYLVEYRAFRAALDAGEQALAVAHAKAAWQAAEETLGDDPQTGILAYNYARMTVFDDSDDAREALRRAQGLQDAGIGRLDARELALYSAFAEFASEGFRRTDGDRLREALEAGICHGRSATTWW